MTISRGASMGTKHTLEPCLVTFRQRSPSRPSVEPRFGVGTYYEERYGN